ncbi:MAG: glycosyltransferase [Planctomycetes bacterium]|nr:glycosyltransferase [Planctomycetota bacterium]
MEGPPRLYDMQALARISSEDEFRVASGFEVSAENPDVLLLAGKPVYFIDAFIRGILDACREWTSVATLRGQGEIQKSKIGNQKFDPRYSLLPCSPEELRRTVVVLLRLGVLEPRTEMPREDFRCANQPEDSPLVSVVTLCFNGAEVIEDLLASVRAQTYPRIEIIVVDNASMDDSRRMLAEIGDVLLVRSPGNVGFARGVNLGVSKADGEFVFIVNQDCVLDENAIANAVAEMSRDPRTCVVGSKLRFLHAPGVINSLGNAMRCFGFGTDAHVGEFDIGQNDGIVSVPSVCFGAALVRKTVFDELRGLDGGYFMYVEDLDFCFRALASGRRVTVAPRSVVYHHFGFSAGKNRAAKLEHVYHGRHRFVRKNIADRKLRRRLARVFFGEERRELARAWRSGEKDVVRAVVDAWAKVLWTQVTGGDFSRPLLPAPYSLEKYFLRAGNVLALGNFERDLIKLTRGQIRKVDRDGNFDSRVLDLRTIHSAGWREIGPLHHIRVQASPGAGALEFEFTPALGGWHLATLDCQTLSDIVLWKNDKIAALCAERSQIESRLVLGAVELRKNEITKLGIEIMDESKFHAIKSLHVTPLVKQGALNVLMISDDQIGTKMAGPGIRMSELARVASKTCNVTLATPDFGQKLPSLPFPVMRYDPLDEGTVRAMLPGRDVIVTQGYTLLKYPCIKDAKSMLAIDLFVPSVLENIHIFKENGLPLEKRTLQHGKDLAVLLDQLRAGDYFFCATERQRDFYLGLLAGVGRLNPATLETSALLEDFIGVVPHGIQEELPARRGKTIQQIERRIKARDFVLLWGGSLSNWFDPITLLGAMKLLREKTDRIKLWFMASKHANPSLPAHNIVRETAQRAWEYGLQDETVFFGESWIPYAERGPVFASASAGISTHRNHLETRMSSRTRLLDYLWAGLPMIATAGDTISEEFANAGALIRVPEGRADHLADAILELYENEERREHMAMCAAALRQNYTWERTTRPLMKFLDYAHHVTSAKEPETAKRILEGRRKLCRGFAPADDAPGGDLGKILSELSDLRAERDVFRNEADKMRGLYARVRNSLPYKIVKLVKGKLKR